MEDFEIRAHIAVFIILIAFQVASPVENPGFGILKPLFILGVTIVYGFVLASTLLETQNRLRR